MFRVFAFVSALALSSSAFAATIGLRGFTYSADSRFTLSLTVDGQPAQLKGNLRYGDKVTVAGPGGLSAELKSYRQESSAVSVIAAIDGQDVASVFLIDDSSDLRILNRNAILERRASAASNLEAIVAKLRDPKFKGWSTLQTFTWMADISNRAPEKQLFTYLDKIELEPVTLPKPTPAAGTSDGTVRTPNLPPAVEPRPNGAPLDITPDGDDDDAQMMTPEQQRRRAYEQARRAEYERQRRRGQDRGPRPYGYPPPPQGGEMYGNNNGYYPNGYPPPPSAPGVPRPPGYVGNPPPGYGNPGYSQQDPNYPQPPARRYRQPQPRPNNGYYPNGYPPPPQQRPGFFEQLFGGNQ